MARWSSRRGRNIRRGIVAMTTAVVVGMSLGTPGALAAQANHGLSLPTPARHGYKAGPAQHNGTAAR